MTEGTLCLGIDTGGTYTDAVLLDGAGRVRAKAKALTTYHNLADGIGGAVDNLMPFDADAVELVSLSTTLATNAIVEDRQARVGLILIGYDQALIAAKGFESVFGTRKIAYIKGGHTIEGAEQFPLDETALARAVGNFKDSVDAFAASGYFSVRNPAHELRAREIVETLTGLPVTCGHELSSRLDSVRRATTTVLNARLIPLLRDLMESVRGALHARGITAPLMVVKGDGSLVKVELALRHPVETILSGPAASAIGAAHLADTGSGVVADMGGTTTDIVVLEGGRPRLDESGAYVGGWHTMIEAVDVHTVGLGGDSWVQLDRDRQLQVGPRRVVPLVLLANRHPEIVESLAEQFRSKKLAYRAGQFVTLRRVPPDGLSDDLAILQDGDAHAVEDLIRNHPWPYILLGELERRFAHGTLAWSALTPTDILHAQGDLSLWDAEAGRFGAQMLARRMERPLDQVCGLVVGKVIEMAAREALNKLIGDAIGETVSINGKGPLGYIMANALGLTDSGRDRLKVAFHLDLPLIAIGAPVDAYYPEVSERLNTRLIIPEHAEVANAVGAIAGSVSQRVTLRIGTTQLEMFRLYAPEGPEDFLALDAAAERAAELAKLEAIRRAQEAGAADIEVRIVRRDSLGEVAGGWGDAVALGAEVTAVATGRPSPARRA